jgi:hypothetical protein
MIQGQNEDMRPFTNMTFQEVYHLDQRGCLGVKNKPFLAMVILAQLRRFALKETIPPVNGVSKTKSIEYPLPYQLKAS